MAAESSSESPLDRLALADPELAEEVRRSLAEKPVAIPDEDVALLVEEILHAMSHDIAFGEIVARGYLRLAGEVSPEQLRQYQEVVRSWGGKGLHLGRIMAENFSPVLRYGPPGFADRFLETVRTMRSVGEYILKDPVRTIVMYLRKGETETASAFLALLSETFSQQMPYKQALHLSHILPGAVADLPPSRRIWQMAQIGQVIRTDPALATPFLDAMQKGLSLLSRPALHRFVSEGIEKYRRNPRVGQSFLTLASKLGMDAYSGLLVTVSLAHVRDSLNRYLKARTGAVLSVRSLSTVPDAFFHPDEERPLSCSDGRFIYLPEEISRFDDREQNRHLYKTLARLESAAYEYGTFHFDLEKAGERCGFSVLSLPDGARGGSDMETFARLFPVPALAMDLFTILEQGRLRILLGRDYPGMVRNAFPVMIYEADRMELSGLTAGLYRTIALGEPETGTALSEAERNLMERLAGEFHRNISTDPAVETVAELVFAFYHETATLLHVHPGSGYQPLRTPFGRKFRSDLVYATFLPFEQKARAIRSRLAEKGLRVYRSDVKQRLIAKKGTLHTDDLDELVRMAGPEPQGENGNAAPRRIDLSALDLGDLLGETAVAEQSAAPSPHPAFWYREWDRNLNDYLHDHVRVLDHWIPEGTAAVYEETLEHRRGLVRQIRHAFELLRPEGLVLLRKWVEGDTFDYQAMLDFAVDRRAGLMPSDRLYIKRIKQQRDVAVLLLVDLSRSTSNTVYGTRSRVIDLEKEAIVLFCEALQVVGDTFAVAGFSGTGRLGADYFRIKDFGDTVDEKLKRRIGGMAPQRSTRMGAAIRHAAAQLETVPARVRLMIILGDGFPNDTDYKREYAIADTRKAIAEARSKNIHARAITVNIVGDARLDDLYGSFHHNVISDVRELPDKLLRIYSALTR